MDYETFRNKVIGKMPELKNVPYQKYEWVIDYCHKAKYTVQDAVREVRSELK